MSLIKKTIKIGSGEKLPFTYEDISIQQSHFAHHSFDIDVSIHAGEAFGVNELKKVLGEKIEISWQTNSKESNKFIGLLDGASVYFVRGNRMLRLEGYSPSILMDAGPRFRVFTEQSLSDVVSKVFGEYSGFQINNEAKGQVEFIVQCQETDFRFLNRLADRFGMNFFYDGEKFHFGDLKKVKSGTVDLKANELYSLEASVNLAPIDFEIRGYNFKKDQIQKADPDEQAYDSNEPLVKAAIEKSDNYPKVRFGLNYQISEETQLKAVGKQLATQQTNDLVSIRGRSSDMKLDVGSKIKIFQKEESALPGIDSGSPFLITSVSHSLSGNDSYQNSFSAMPADHPFSVNVPNTKPPICGPLGAIVKDLNDTEGLGRVRVQFLHDENEALSPWIRVLTKHTSYGGSFWLPHLEEKVMVFFEDFNPEKSAFVMGAFFTGNEKTNNNERGFFLENIKMAFNDESGELKINAKSIVLEAESEIISKAQKLVSEAKQGIEIDGGQSIKQKAVRIDLN